MDILSNKTHVIFIDTGNSFSEEHGYGVWSLWWGCLNLLSNRNCKWKAYHLICEFCCALLCRHASSWTAERMRSQPLPLWGRMHCNTRWVQVWPVPRWLDRKWNSLYGCWWGDSYIRTLGLGTILIFTSLQMTVYVSTELLCVVFCNAVSHGGEMHKYITWFPLRPLSCWLHGSSGAGGRTCIRICQQAGMLKSFLCKNLSMHTACG